MDADALAHFLRSRRYLVQPEDIGIPRQARRRARGLRREEVAALSSMSADYYKRLERGIGHQPSAGILAAIADSLRLGPDEQDHLFRLAGHEPPAASGSPSDRPDPGLVRVLDLLDDGTPAAIVTSLGETLQQNAAAIALFGVETRFTGHARCAAYRWFTDPGERQLYPAADHTSQGRIHAAQLRTSTTMPAVARRAAGVVDALLERSSEFARLWAEHPVGLRHGQQRRLVHPRAGELRLYCQILLDPDGGQALILHVAEPGSADARRLAVLVAGPAHA